MSSAAAAFRRKKEFISPLLQPPINRLFVPRPTPSFLPSLHQDQDGYQGPRLSPIAAYMQELNQEKPVSPTESSKSSSREAEEGEISGSESQSVGRKRRLKAHTALQAALVAYDPHAYPLGQVTSDPQRTLFIGRLAYSVTAEQLRPMLERYGPVEEIKMICDREGKPRGYAFAQFARKEDLRRAYDRMDAMKIEGRRIVVDAERGRTQAGWRPRRLGGGLGRTRAPRSHRH